MRGNAEHLVCKDNCRMTSVGDVDMDAVVTAHMSQSQ